MNICEENNNGVMGQRYYENNEISCFFCFPSSNLEFSIVSLCIYKCFAFSAHRIDTSDRLPITFVHGDDAGTAAAFVAGNLVFMLRKVEKKFR